MSDTVSVTENYGCYNGCQTRFHGIFVTDGLKILHLVEIEDPDHVVNNRGREVGPALGSAQNRVS